MGLVSLGMGAPQCAPCRRAGGQWGSRAAVYDHARGWAPKGLPAIQPALNVPGPGAAASNYCEYWLLVQYAPRVHTYYARGLVCAPEGLARFSIACRWICCAQRAPRVKLDQPKGTSSHYGLGPYELAQAPVACLRATGGRSQVTRRLAPHVWTACTGGVVDQALAAGAPGLALFGERGRRGQSVSESATCRVGPVEER